MAQQSVRRGRKNQGFPPCFTSTLRVMWFRSANSHTGSQHSSTAASEAGQMAASDDRVRPIQKSLASKGASTDGKRTFVTYNLDRSDGVHSAGSTFLRLRRNPSPATV